jgi:TRAP-type mannitol/chloroaromatic compound transport system permease small subunit
VNGLLANGLAFARLMDGLSERVGRLVSWLILGAVLVSTLNALIRYAFNIGSNAFLELQWYLFSAVFLLGSAWTLKRNEHIRIDVVVGRFSPRVHAWIDILGTLFFLLPLCAIVLYNGIPFAIDAIQSNEQSTNAGGLVVWPAKILLPLGFILLALQGLAELFKRAAFLGGLIDGKEFEKGGGHGVDQEEIKREIEAIAAANKIQVSALGVEQHDKK